MLTRKTPMRRVSAKKEESKRMGLSEMKRSGLVQKASAFTSRPRKKLKPRSPKNKGWVDVALARWNEPNNNHCCEVCGTWLGNDFSPAFYHHLLHRGSYKWLARSPLNMPQLCLADHDKAHKFTVEALSNSSHPHQAKWKELHERMIYMRANNLKP